MLVPKLPVEIIDKILDFKEILEIPLPAKYIITKNINGIIKEQVAKVYFRYKVKGCRFMYEYNYGVMGFHEGFCYSDSIRDLTDQERQYSSENKFWKLPQQFYQSTPSF